MKKSTGIGIGLGIGILAYAFYEPYRYTVKHYEITHPNIPKDFDGFKIAFLADIHYGRTSKLRFLTKIIDRVNSFRPDMVVLGGDYITHKKYIEPCFEVIKSIEAPFGIYGVFGNHDVEESMEQTLYYMQKAGVQSVHNTGVWIKKKNAIKVGGVGDFTTQDQDLDGLTHDLTKDDYAILLTHNPKYIYQIKDSDHIGLALAGHTHGAQFSMIKHLDKVTPNRINHKLGIKYLSGKYAKGTMDIIVSNGIGTAKFPFRFLTPPEIIMITLKSNK